MAELDPEMVAHIQDRVRFARLIVDTYNAEILRSQGIEPTPQRLQDLCHTNRGAAFTAFFAFAAEGEKQRLSNE